jgi:hypothetical protein
MMKKTPYELLSINKIKNYSKDIGGKYASAWPTTCRVMYRMHVGFLINKIKQLKGKSN